jgi:hypothetical protein
MESVVTATSEETTSPDLVVKLLTVESGRFVAQGWASLSALRAFASTGATGSLPEIREEHTRPFGGTRIVAVAVGHEGLRLLGEAGLIKATPMECVDLKSVEIRIAALYERLKENPDPRFPGELVAHILPANHGKSEARINVGYIGHVSRDKGTLAEALTKIGLSEARRERAEKFNTQVIVDDMARDFAKQAVEKLVKAFNDMEVVKHTRPHITEKPYGKAHRRRFRR